MRNFFVQLGLGVLLVIIVVVIIVILVAAPETGLEGLASGGQSLLSGETVVDGDFTQFLGECCLGLGLWLLIGGVAFVTWESGSRIWELKKRKEALAWELKDQLKELDEQLDRGAITQEEYEQKEKKLKKESLKRPREKRKKLMRKVKKGWKEKRVEWIKEAAASELGYDLNELKEQLSKGVITQEQYERKKKLLEGLIELKEQLNRGVIHLTKYEQEKKKLLEKSKA